MNIAEKLVEMGLSVNEPHQVLELYRFEDSSFMSAQDGYTSLHWACSQGHDETAELLISLGADIEAKNEVAHAFSYSEIFSFFN